MTTNPARAIVVYDPGRVDPEHVALAGFLGGYRGLTRDAYALDLRQFVVFCAQRHLGLFEVRRSDIETFGRNLEARGRATATIARRHASPRPTRGWTCWCTTRVPSAAITARLPTGRNSPWPPSSSGLSCSPGCCCPCCDTARRRG